jgi:hypothetical protein
VTQSLKTLLNANSEFKAILQKTQLLNALQAQFVIATPPYLAQCSQVTGLQFGTLSIATSNATAAAKLKQLAPEIVNQLKNQGAEVSGLRIKVQVSYFVPVVTAPPRQLSSAAQHAIQQLEDRLSDTPLKAALHKFIR